MAVPNQVSTDRAYHQHNRKLPLADRIGYVARTRVYHLFWKLMQPEASSTILDIGVTDDIDASAANLLEQLYPYKNRLTCAGITEGNQIERTYPGVRYVQITPGMPLPFEDREFDIVYSNAVLEHVGSRDKQREFVREACRVSQKAFIAVPNRLFPVEVHTGIPLLHWLSAPLFRAALRGGRFDFFSHEENLNYISARELRQLYPVERFAKTVCAGVGFGPFQSNLISYYLPQPIE